MHTAVLRMEAVNTFETSASFYQTTRLGVLERRRFRTHRSEKLYSHRLNVI
jgi:hypothetical protein